MTFTRLTPSILLILSFGFSPVVSSGGVRAGSVPANQQAAAQSAALTNEDIIKMVQFKLGDAVIISKIKTSTCRFDTSTEALLKLKEAGVSDAVIQAMVEASAAGSGASETERGPKSTADSNNPLAPHDPGIYWLSKNDNKMVQLEPTVYSQGKSGGLFVSAVTHGIVQSKWKAVVQRPRAQLRIAETQPEFWFYFEEKSHGLSDTGFFTKASSPNEFVLVLMERKKNSRELIVAQSGAYRHSVGPRSEDVIPIRFEKVAPGVYKVVPERPLKPGEYCFFYAGTAVTWWTASTGKLFDFGIDTEN
ncbi:MAG: hypothetical protein QXS54_07095 [Candidatus Methanomethylicaceae archaeon]